MESPSICGSECVAAEKVADDQGVGGIIKLLEQIPEMPCAGRG